jgi:multidrug efflux pump subunit AcrA (membrane-fusion protein)
LAERLRKLDEPDSGHPESHLGGSLTRPILLILALGLIVAGGGVGAWYYLNIFGSEDRALQFEPIERGRLVFSIVEKGELEASRNTDINCKVRSSGRGNNVATSIKWLIDEGAKVKEGDVICRLDDAGLKEQLANQEIAVASAKSALTQAEKDKEITASQNEGDLETARNNVQLAAIDLERYEKGELDRLSKDILGKITTAEADMLQWKDKSSYSGRMAKRGFVSRQQAESDDNRRLSSEVLHSQHLREQSMLRDYDSRRNILDLKNKLEQAKTALKVAEISAAGKTAKAQADYDAKRQILQQEETKLSDLKEDVANCEITAPHDGMVVFHVDERSRFGGGSSQNMVAVNEPVREGQRLMRIPDLREMQVKVKVHEALVPRLYLQQDTADVGLPAQVKIAALDQPLNGHVKEVSNVSSSTDWSMADVKVYPTTVLVDQKIEGLKPGMSAEVTIKVEELENVIRMPVHAVLESNGRKFCYVGNGSGIEKRMLITGLNNNKFVEIKETEPPAGWLREGERYGVKEGEIVVMNPRALAERRNDLHVDQRDPGENVSQAITTGPKKNGNGKVNGTAPVSPGERGRGERGPGESGTRSGRGPRGGGGPGGPGVGAPGGGGPGGSGGFQPSEEQRQRMQKFNDDFKKATPAERKKMLEQIPEAFREQAKQRMKDQGFQIDD